MKPAKRIKQSNAELFSVETLPIRVRRSFEVSRKLGETHQRVLVFVKGDPRSATRAVGDSDYGAPLPEGV